MANAWSTNIFEGTSSCHKTFGIYQWLLFEMELEPTIYRLHDYGFLSKSSKFCVARIIRFVQISSAHGTNIKVLQIIFRTYNMTSIYNNMEAIERKIYCQDWCSDRVFYFTVTVTDADIDNLKYHLLFLNKYLYHRLAEFEHYRKHPKFWSFLEKKKKKTLNYFWQSVDDIVEEVTVAKTIVWCWTVD